MAAGGGLLTAADLAAYEVVERAPLVVSWRGHRLLTNPPPAFGGELVALGPAPAGGASRSGRPRRAHADHAVALVDAMVRADEVRAAGAVAAELARRRATGGTTHVSVRDAEGNVATMTSSNGEGSGWVVPGTGIIANNMMGEDDLHPAGFHASPPGERVASMMARPWWSTATGRCGSSSAAAGASASAPRSCRSSPGWSTRAATSSRPSGPRGCTGTATVVHAEPGWSDEALGAVERRWPVVRWTDRDLYFGGVHAVAPGAAAGDPRRGGSIALT